ncbi:hypothetical protein [Streptomyces sp. NPDC060322]|uniref:hypothetical protein n=1 Tax=Streptomyces sp. NPDC060322 TaxID=3347097 RepID=UPI003653A94A
MVQQRSEPWALRHARSLTGSTPAEPGSPTGKEGQPVAASVARVSRPGDLRLGGYCPTGGPE